NRRYCLKRSAFWLDFAEFDEASARGRHHWANGETEHGAAAYEEALGLYRGDFFGDADLLEWFSLDRHHYRGAALALRHQLAEHYALQGHYEEARSHWVAILGLDGVDERAHCGLLRLYGQFGQWGHLQEQFVLMRQACRQQLDSEPPDSARVLYERLLAAREGERAAIRTVLLRES
ncbi:MAG: bacterial transcriptional activator domain-containing protein, partial [Cyanobacteria bacterium REEB65]|nr:bacterial transcriptional activator domain-containing protein [Cyanobacteria bacterium REEB65]